MAVAVAVVATTATIAAVPLAWHVALHGAVNRIDADVMAQRAEYVAYDPPSWPGDRDCDTVAELASRYPSPRDLSRDDDLVHVVEQAVRCRRAWNSDLGPHQWIGRRTFGSYTVHAYLRAASGSEPDDCLAAAATALRLAARLGTGVGAEPEMVRIPAERLLLCLARASQAARAAALVHVVSAATDPASAVDPGTAWPALQPVAVATASSYMDQVRDGSRLPVMFRLLTRPREAAALWEWERWAHHALAIAEDSRECDDACLVRLLRKAQRHVTSYASGGASRPILAQASALVWFRSYFRAAVVALDPARVSDPRFASPWDGSAMRVVPSDEGIRVEWNGPDGRTSGLPRRDDE